MRGVLGGDHEEGVGQHPRLSLGGDLMLFHGLEQRALRLWRGAIDLVGENDLGEDRAGVKLERSAVPVENRNAEDIGRQKIAGELDALEIKPEGFRQRMGQRRLADSRQILDQQVPSCEQAGERQAYLVLFSKDDPADV
jgi:hypothetical protein